MTEPRTDAELAAAIRALTARLNAEAEALWPLLLDAQKCGLTVKCWFGRAEIGAFFGPLEPTMNYRTDEVTPPSPRFMSVAISRKIEVPL